MRLKRVSYIAWRTACQEEVESQLHSEDIFAAWIGADVLGWRVPARWCSAASERVQRVTR
jgi:hypothetical protein